MILDARGSSIPWRDSLCDLEKTPNGIRTPKTLVDDTIFHEAVHPVGLQEDPDGPPIHSTGKVPLQRHMCLHSVGRYDHVKELLFDDRRAGILTQEF